jgi:energy-converting hydrogenase Eha subunit C
MRKRALSTASSLSSILHDVMEEDGALSYSGNESDDEDSTSDQTFRTIKSEYSKLKEIKAIQDMARTETIRLRTWRCIVMIAMLLTGAVLSVGAYRYLIVQEHKKALESVRVVIRLCACVCVCSSNSLKLTLFTIYSPQYELFTDTVKKASNKQFEDFKLGLTIMAQTITVAGSTSTRPFPFVRVPMYEVTGSHARELSGVEFVAWSPLVQPSDREQWTEFVTAQSDWYNESKRLVHFEALSSYDTNSTMRPVVWRGNRSIHGKIEPVHFNEPVYPIFQCSPPPHSAAFMNFDMRSEPNVFQLLPSLEATRSGLLTTFDRSYADLPDSYSPPDYQDDFHRQFSTTATQGAVDHPHSMFVQPVFADVNNDTSNMVGFLTSVVAWDVFFADLLPEHVKGIIAVLKSSCGNAYTYELRGRRVRKNNPRIQTLNFHSLTLTISF